MPLAFKMLMTLITILKYKLPVFYFNGFEHKFL